MRYKIKTNSLDVFRKAKSLVAGETQIFVSSERRLSLSTGDLSAATKAKLINLGARVVPDMQFHADAA
ncbi:hypothetical protein [Sphingomonas sp. LaA6.9]|uniref:hypothetical protein n=1 Tax=Sphingomonas sp. LaA6.9 TaxID=2919914 RepID=UPI001F4F67C1|nr:hypothetical protein [Sphingomonas sp. LaA6.9]MCJ8157061.1 hypothetical protein [Sphingomonas sp. LaA6.9]